MEVGRTQMTDSLEEKLAEIRPEDTEEALQ